MPSEGTSPAGAHNSRPLDFFKSIAAVGKKASRVRISTERSDRHLRKIDSQLLQLQSIADANIQAYLSWFWIGQHRRFGQLVQKLADAVGCRINGTQRSNGGSQFPIGRASCRESGW